MIKKQKSHISISSIDYKINNVKETKKSINNNNNNNIEQYLNKLILISLKHKKFLERNDYFYSKFKKNNNTKKIKLKLTPFQKYEKYKIISKKIKSNKNLIPLNINNINLIQSKNINLNLNNLTTKNNNLRKNRTQENNKFCITNYHPNYLNNNNKIRNKTKVYINSIGSNRNLYKPNLRIKKNKYSNISYDNVNILNVNKNSKMCQTYRNKTAFRSLKNRIESSFSNISKNKNKRSIEILTSAIRPLRIINLKSRNKKIFGLPKINNDDKNFQIPLIHMNDSNFLNEIISLYK
jgi:hypothetical protein